MSSRRPHHHHQHHQQQGQEEARSSSPSPGDYSPSRRGSPSRQVDDNMLLSSSSSSSSSLPGAEGQSHPQRRSSGSSSSTSSPPSYSSAASSVLASSSTSSSSIVAHALSASLQKLASFSPASAVAAAAGDSKQSRGASIEMKRYSADMYRDDEDGMGAGAGGDTLPLLSREDIEMGTDSGEGGEGVWDPAFLQPPPAYTPLAQRLAHKARRASAALFSFGGGSSSSAAPHSYYPLSTTRSRKRHRILRLLPLVLLLLVAHGICWILFEPTPYIRLPPPVYFDTLKEVANKHFPRSSAMQSSALGLLDAAEGRVRSQRTPSPFSSRPAEPLGALSTEPSSTAKSVVPKTLFSSDRTPDAPKAWFESWSARGFAPVRFMNDRQADSWMLRTFAEPSSSPEAEAQAEAEAKGIYQRREASASRSAEEKMAAYNNASTVTLTNSSIVHAWNALPRGVLRADFLRYALLLAEGGTWSDMDVEPLRPLSDWVQDVKVLRSGTRGKEGEERQEAQQQQPIRAIVGIECDPINYLSISFRAWLEWIRLLPMNRHRNIQFVQWTLHSAPGHPILVDVMRRLLEADRFFSAYKSELLRKVFQSSSPADLAELMKKASARASWSTIRSEENAQEWALQRLALASKKVHPWTNIRMVLRWIRGAYRMSYHELSVEEWTGPAVWTDAVMSYLNLMGGVKPEQLMDLKVPIQVDDVLILPVSWFHPATPERPDPESRVSHHHRGSWKLGADVARKAGSTSNSTGSP